MLNKNLYEQIFQKNVNVYQNVKLKSSLLKKKLQKEEKLFVYVKKINRIKIFSLKERNVSN
jgi:hypothetical protein